VRIFATVLKDGTPLKGLGAADFRVRADEVDQEPLSVEPKLPPLSVVITLDASGSMNKRIKEAQAAAQHFLETLGSGDSVQVVAFAREVKSLTSMSSDRQLAGQAIGSTVARGDTALYDALLDSIQLVKDRTGRKAIVLLSDGVDDDGTGKPLSKHTVKEVIGSAREVNVPIYVLGLGEEKDLDTAGLTAIANETGALYQKTPDPSALKDLYEKIGAQLAGQYAISYTSNLPADGTEHRVALTSQGITNTKAYTAPGNAVAKAPEPAPVPTSSLNAGDETACYDEAASKSIAASLQKNNERYARKLIDVVERDQRRQELMKDLDNLLAQGANTESCIVKQLGPINAFYKDKLSDVVQRDEGRKLLVTKLQNLCTPKATDVAPIENCLNLLNVAYDQQLIDVVQRDQIRQGLWKALHDLLLAKAQNDEQTYQALDVVKQLYEKKLIDSVQRDNTRQALSKK
jgi:VWFA-related protein